jgi:hypothetical protein
LPFSDPAGAPLPRLPGNRSVGQNHLTLVACSYLVVGEAVPLILDLSSLDAGCGTTSAGVPSTV